VKRISFLFPNYDLKERKVPERRIDGGTV